MTLKRIDIEASKLATFAATCSNAELVVDAIRVYSIEHSELGHAILIQRRDGSATAFADEVRFLASGMWQGTAFAPTAGHAEDEPYDDLAATMAELDKM